VASVIHSSLMKMMIRKCKLNALKACITLVHALLLASFNFFLLGLSLKLPHQFHLCQQFALLIITGVGYMHQSTHILTSYINQSADLESFSGFLYLCRIFCYGPFIKATDNTSSGPIYWPFGLISKMCII